MGKELFNQPLISSPSEPEDNDRVGFGQPSVAGGKNMLWSYFKQLIQAIASVFDWIDFNPQATPPSYVVGRIFYDETENTHTFYNDIEGISLQVGEELRARLENDTGDTLENGVAVAVIGAVGASLQVELLDASNIDSSVKAFGLMTIETIDGEPGYAVRYGAVRELNTLGMAVGSLIYGDPDTLGGWTNTRPSEPNYPVRIGIVIAEHATEGVIGVDTLAFNGTDTSVNLEGYLNGTVTHVPQVDISVSGGIIYADVTDEQHPAKNLPYMLSDDLDFLNTTTNTGAGGAARVIVPPGASSTEKQTSFIYIYDNAGTPTLAASTTEPTVPYALICYLTVFDAIRTDSDGQPFGYRRHNNEINREDGTHDGAFGLSVEIINAIRLKLGSNWISGQDATTTVDNTEIQIALSSGIGAQFRRQNLPAFTGDDYLIYNDTSNLVVYDDSINLTDITTTANGTSLLSNNSHYTIRIFYQLNSNGVGNHVIATRPLNKYATAAEAIQDPSNYTINVNDTDIEEIVFPLYDLVISRTGAGGTTITLTQLTNLRTKLAGGVGGGGASGGGGTDDKVRITASDTTNDYLDPKIVVSSSLTKTTQNPAGNESLLFDIAATIVDAKSFAEDLTLEKNLELPHTDASTIGVINKDAVSFIHDFSHPTGGGAIPAGQNVFMGLGAGNFTMGSTATNVIEGSYNVAIGGGAFSSNTIGYYNVAIGFDSLASNTIGRNLMAFGFNSLKSNTEGIDNTAISTYSLTNNTTGSSLTAIGYATLLNNTEGIGSTAIGHNSLRNNVTGDYSIGIGYHSGYFATGSNELYISSLSSTAQVDQATAKTKVIIYGEQSATTTSQTLALNAQVHTPYKLTVGTNLAYDTTEGLWFGNGDTGIYESSDDSIVVDLNGSLWLFNSSGILQGNSRARISSSDPTSVLPNLIPKSSNVDTGIGWAGTDQLSLIAGGVEGLRLEKASSHVIQKVEVSAGITANTTQTQGQTPILSSFNEISIVANANDVVTMPTVTIGYKIVIINNGANTLQIFPASGDDLGAGIDTSVTLASGLSGTYLAYDVTNWATI